MAGKGAAGPDAARYPSAWGLRGVFVSRAAAARQTLCRTVKVFAVIEEGCGSGSEGPVKRCFVGTWTSPGFVLTLAGLELSLGRERGNGGSRCVAMATQGAVVIGISCLFFHFSAQAESQRRGPSASGALEGPRPPTARRAPLTLDKVVGQGDCSLGLPLPPPSTRFATRTLGAFVKKRKSLCLLKFLFFFSSFAALIPIR